MAIIYGPTHAAFLIWKHGEPLYLIWENIFARKINGIVYGVGSANTDLTDADDILIAYGIITEIMARLNDYIARSSRGESTTQEYGKDGFPEFTKSQMELLKGLQSDEDDTSVIEVFTASGFGMNSNR